MLYLKIEDEYFYTKEGRQELSERYGINIDEIVFARDRSVILDSFEDGSISEKTFIAPYLPEALSPSFKEIFDVIRVENKYGLLTKIQHEKQISPMQILKDKLGANIYSPSVTFNDYIIDKDSSVFKNMMNGLKLIKSRKAFGIVSRGFFLTGVPGTGKTFFAKCIAGELNRYLVELNLSFFINSDDTFGLLNKFFDFFKFTEGEYILLIDEIEKMFNETPKAKQVLGYLLTVLNEFGDKNKRNKADVLFIATANNVTELVRKNPELFRKGRFDMSIYLTAPSENKALNTFESYIKKYQNLFETTSLPSVFYAVAVDYDNKSYKYLPNSRIEKIYQIVKSDGIVMQRIGEYDKEINEESKADFLSFLVKNDHIKNLIDRLKIDFKFEIDIDTIITTALGIYRNKIETDRSLFPYVPAEIESIVGEMYSNYYFEEYDLLENLDEYFQINTPLQISMLAGILEMNGATKNFMQM